MAKGLDARESTWLSLQQHGQKNHSLGHFGNRANREEELEGDLEQSEWCACSDGEP
jgi:hypothetical protein